MYDVINDQYLLFMMATHEHLFYDCIFKILIFFCGFMVVMISNVQIREYQIKFAGDWQYLIPTGFCCLLLTFELRAARQIINMVEMPVFNVPIQHREIETKWILYRIAAGRMITQDIDLWIPYTEI